MFFRRNLLGLLVTFLFTSSVWAQDVPDTVSISGAGISRFALELKLTSQFQAHPKARTWLKLLEKNLCWSGAFELHQPKNKYCPVERGAVDFRMQVHIEKTGAVPRLQMVIADRKGTSIVGRQIQLRQNRLQEEHLMIAINQFTELLTSKPGILGSTMAFTFKQPRHEKVIARVNTHGQNIKGVSHTEKAFINIAPSWDPTGSSIVYTTLRRQGTSVVVRDDLKGNLEALAEFNGLSTGGSWSADGKKLFIAASEKADGNIDLFQLDLRTQKRQRLTRHRKIDVAPSLSPDGKTLLFASDRAGGSEQIYAMDMDTRVINRMTFRAVRNTDPVWSPDGTLIAYTRSLNGKDQIMVMDANGENARALTNSRYQSEQPAWSPDGRQIVFASKRGRDFKLYSVFLDGKGLRRITTTPSGFEEKDPVWTLNNLK